MSTSPAGAKIMANIPSAAQEGSLGRQLRSVTCRNAFNVADRQTHARNELINFKAHDLHDPLTPKGSQSPERRHGRDHRLCDLTDPDQMKPAKGTIKTAIEFTEQRGTKCSSCLWLRHLEHRQDQQRQRTFISLPVELENERPSPMSHLGD